jgi:C4-dicarboxylate-binding protein DctP
MTMRYILALLAALASACPAVAAEPIVIKFSHVVAPDTPKGKAAEKFKALAEAMSAGRVKVEIYPNSELFRDTDELAALQRGEVQMVAPSISRLSLEGATEFEVFDLPYLFADYDSVHRVTEGEEGRRLLAGLEARGMHGLAFWDNGFKIMSADRALHEPEDYRGLKMRVQSSQVIQAQMRALGALPQVISFADAYKALKSGTVDGTENVPSNMYTQRMHEVQKHLTITEHGYLGYAVIIGKPFWDGLSPDIRAILNQAMERATAYANEIAEEENFGALAKIRAAGTTEIYEPTPAERKALIKALLPVHKQMADRIGKKTLEAVYQAAGFRQP